MAKLLPSQVFEAIFASFEQNDEALSIPEPVDEDPVEADLSINVAEDDESYFYHDLTVSQ